MSRIPQQCTFSNNALVVATFPPKWGSRNWQWNCHSRMLHMIPFWPPGERSVWNLEHGGHPNIKLNCCYVFLHFSMIVSLNEEFESWIKTLQFQRGKKKIRIRLNLSHPVEFLRTDASSSSGPSIFYFCEVFWRLSYVRRTSPIIPALI